MEERMGFGFPRTYREFLICMGLQAGLLFRGSDAIPFYPEALLEAAHEMFEEQGNPFDLPEPVLVFFMHQGYVIRYLPIDGNDDPPAYQYLEGDRAPTLSSPRFSTFLETTIDRTIHEEGLVAEMRAKHTS